MLDPTHPITPFFDDAPERVLACLPDLEQSSGQVTSMDMRSRAAGKAELIGLRNGLFAPTIFGEPGSFGHITTAGVIHPCVFSELVSVFQIDTPYLIEIAIGKKALRGDKLVDNELDFEADDICGPHAIAEALKRLAPDHPLLPLCTLTKIPVPPLAARPTTRLPIPEAVDDWVGPVNEAWRDLVLAAGQELRLLELDVPPIIAVNQACTVQRAWAEVYARTRRAENVLVPPLVRRAVEDDRTIGIAFAGPERLVIQRPDATLVVDLSGRELVRAAPAGTELRGVVEGRYAVFHGFFQETQPYFVTVGDEAEPIWPAWFLDGGTLRMMGEISVLDVDTGAFLERAPRSIPRTLVENDQPEDLFLGERKLNIGGDRPGVSAYTHDLSFALVSGEGREVIDMRTGITVAIPADIYPDEVAKALDLATGEVVDHEWDDIGGGWGGAVGFADGHWWFVSDYGVVHDHLGNEQLALVPPPQLAAFDPTCTRLAVTLEDAIVIIDRATRAVIGRVEISDDA